MRNDCIVPAINSRAAHFQRKRRIADAFAEAGLPLMSAHLNDCQEISRQCVCTHCANVFYIPDRCRQRTCPLCSYRESKKRGEWIVKLCAEMKFPKFVTLTMPRWEGATPEGISYLREKFNELRKSECFAKVLGGVYQIELKPKPTGWHIHLHCILDSPYLPYQQLFSTWTRLLGVAYANVDIRAATTPQEQIYVAKYASKAADYEGDISDVVEWYLATKGKRLFAAFGTWYHREPASELVEEPMQSGKFACPFCGTQGTSCTVDQLFFVVGRDCARFFEKSCAAQGPPTISMW
jgi:hypothetical protein